MRRKMSMKKFFIALSVLAALTLGVVPSQALVGMPDRVPANELISFFVVAMDRSLDTLIIVQETGVHGATATAAYSLHWKMWDPDSAHKADRSIPYTRNDVVAISCGDIIFDTLTVNERISLEADLNTDGVNESYIGYVTWNDELAGVEVNDANHFVGKQYLVNLAGGIGSGVSIAGRESLTALDNAPVGAAFMAQQSEVDGITATPITYTGVLEGWSPIAYATTAYRQMMDAQPATTLLPDFFRLLPRWYLYSSAGENNIFIWKSHNAPGAAAAGVSWSFSMMVYDNEENPTSKQINIPRELNFIDVREVIPPDWIPTSGTIAGWFDIRFPSTSGSVGNPLYWQYMDFLCYSWQRAQNSSASLNWSALFESHREVGTLQ
jgi:hypothetical protein